jgi:hypothetical protein
VRSFHLTLRNLDECPLKYSAYPLKYLRARVFSSWAAPTTPLLLYRVLKRRSEKLLLRKWVTLTEHFIISTENLHDSAFKQRHEVCLTTTRPSRIDQKKHHEGINAYVPQLRCTA